VSQNGGRGDTSVQKDGPVGPILHIVIICEGGIHLVNVLIDRSRRALVVLAIDKAGEFGDKGILLWVGGELTRDTEFFFRLKSWKLIQPKTIRFQLKNWQKRDG
jgi:hypothetical protein